MINDFSRELLDSINTLKKSIDTMMELFTEAAKEIKVEGSEGPVEISSMNEKLDKILDQNREIIEMIGSFTGKPKPQQSFNFQKHGFQPAPKQNFQQYHGFQQQFNEPRLQELDELPELKKLDYPPRPNQQGPIAMPSIPFPNIEGHKKKGLFGRLKR